ncbi:hypothetical protein Bca4012_045541 [Brassica carinata]
MFPLTNIYLTIPSSRSCPSRPIEAFIKYSSTQYKTRLQSFLDTLSSSSPWNPIPIKGYHVIDHDETPPVTEIFSELHFKESSSTENSSLQLCTEGLGVKKKTESNDEECGPQEKERKEYPPAMTRMSFKTYREEGIPRREFLRASREDGRLQLKLAQSDEDEDEKKDKPV